MFKGTGTTIILVLTIKDFNGKQLILNKPHNNWFAFYLQRNETVVRVDIRHQASEIDKINNDENQWRTELP